MPNVKFGGAIVMADSERVKSAVSPRNQRRRYEKGPRNGGPYPVGYRWKATLI